MTPRRSVPLAAVALVASALLAACQPTNNSSGDSAGDFRGEQRLVAQTVDDLQGAASDSDEAEICRDLLARSLAGRLAQGGRSCAAAVEEAIKDADGFDMTVERVTVDGDRATARVKVETGDRDRRANLQLVRERGRWKISDL